jgi:hypothetical protein
MHYEDRNKKSNGEQIRARFVLTAGHCFFLGETVYRTSSNAKEGGPREDRVPIGTVNRHGVEQGSLNFTGVDGEGIRFEGSDLAPHEIDWNGRKLPAAAARPAELSENLCVSGAHTRLTSRANRSSLPVHEAGRIRPAETLCFSGVSSGIVKCGSAVGIRAVKLKTSDEPNHGRELAIRFQGQSIHGDSGSPVWEAKTKEVVGIFHASYEGALFAAPLLRPRGFPSEKAPGVLAALDAAGGGELSLERAP